jgi:tungstate transport system substrate-binding protein
MTTATNMQGDGHGRRVASGGEAVLLSLALALTACAPGSPEQHLDIATTTTVEASGLLEELLPAFSGIRVRVHATSSVRALEMLSDGVVDVAITHAPGAEARYLERHRDWSYTKVAYNRMVLVGPPEDPARVREAVDVVDAFRRIASSRMTFTSRRDQSGTDERERALWRAAETTPPESRIIVSSTDMVTALVETDERQGYTLTDEATYQQLKPRLDLVALWSGGAQLLNTLAVIHPLDNAAAGRFAEWLTAGEGRRRIGVAGSEGRAAFAAWPDGCAADAPDALPCR